MANCIRLALTTIAVLALSACNQLVSTEPWFTEADSVGAPSLREGLWAFRSEDDCSFDEQSPAASWPACAGALVVRGQDWFPIVRVDDGRSRGRLDHTSRLEIFPTLIANGDPLVVQMWPPEESLGRSAQLKDNLPGYFYMGLRPLEFDSTGHITSFRSWFVQCGPLTEHDLARAPPQKGSDAQVPEEGSYVTQQPFPGLTVQDYNCLADSQASVHRAALLSEELPGDHAVDGHWVRDGPD